MKRNSLDVITVKEKKINNRVLRSGFLRRSPIADHRKQYLPIRSPIPIFLLCRIIYSDTPIRNFRHLFRAWISFWEWISPLGDSCEGDFLIWGVEGEFFRHFFKNIYLSHLNVWSCSAFLFLQSCNSLHRAQAWFCELYMRWSFMPGSHIGLFRLQCVCSPCVVRKRCRSSTDCAFTQESATDLWLFTTNTTFIHYFDFKSKHCHWKCFFSIVIVSMFIKIT